MRHHLIEDCGALQCSVIPLTPTPSSIVSFTTLTASNSLAKACVGPEQSKPGKVDQQPSLMTETNVLEEPRPRAI
jgi:hypothetical protein